MSDQNPFNPTQHSPLLIVISGPSGVGKDSVIRRMKARQLPFHFVVTATTRSPRPDEMHGKDYFFFSKDQFAEMIERGELMEYALVYDDYKGIPKEQVHKALASGVDVVMRLDVQGAATVRRLSPEALLIFITANSQAEMMQRLEARMTESPEELKLRIATARQEMQRLGDFDYVVVNAKDRLDDTVDTVLAIIKAEHCRVNPRKVTL
jgi:guanylate kinase